MTTSQFRPEANDHKANVKKLSDLSRELRPNVGEGKQFPSLKAALIDAYTSGKSEGVEFKSRGQWAEEGFEIKANMRAWLFWGKPKTSEGEDGQEKRFFPVIYLYSSNQVKKADPAPEAEEVKEDMPF
jgi:hypothetical protein